MWAIYTTEPDGVKIFLEGFVFSSEGEADNRAKELTQLHGRLYRSIQVDHDTVVWLSTVEE